MFVKRVKFHYAIPTLAFSWGIICLCTGFIENFAGLVVTRLLLGVFEGCLFPSMTLLLVNWYKREEIATRISFLYSKIVPPSLFRLKLTLLLSRICFVGSLWWFDCLCNSLYGWSSWLSRMAMVIRSASPLIIKSLNHYRLYIIEGVVTVLFSVVCFFAIPKSYETAYFLNEEDKAIMKIRLEQMESYSGGTGKYTKKDMKNAAMDPKTWIHGILQIFLSTIIYGKSISTFAHTCNNINKVIYPGFGTFLPVILNSGFHYSTMQSQYFVIPGRYTMFD